MPPTVQWQFEGNGCCWNPGEAGRPEVLFDHSVGDGADTEENRKKCEDKCLNYGDQCRLISFLRGWCSVYNYTGRCPHAPHANSSDCGSTGVNATTWYYGGPALTPAPTPAPAPQWQFEGNGCCWNPGEAGRPKVLFDHGVGDGADTEENRKKCEDKCLNYGDQCRLISFVKGWCTVYNYTGRCPHAPHANSGDCGSTGVGATTWYYPAPAAPAPSPVPTTPASRTIII